MNLGSLVSPVSFMSLVSIPLPPRGECFNLEETATLQGSYCDDNDAFSSICRQNLERFEEMD